MSEVERESHAYRERAALALRSAEITADPSLRQVYLGLAHAYDNLAGMLELIERGLNRVRQRSIH
jgi:hypothetical protein